MKLTIIGGGGVRTPRLIPALVKRAQRLNLEEVWLMDIQAEKLDLIGSLCRAVAQQHQAPFELVLTTDPRAAIQDTTHVITSIRPGFESGRAIDERIALQHKILGQETTGAVGFAMAMRSIPALLDYARMVREWAQPGAWIFNFTNPAGLVTQALIDAGFERVIGICDSANEAQHGVSRFMRIPRARIHHEVYGLNHLSWTRSVRIDPEPDGTGGEEVLPGLLADEKFLQSTLMEMFDRELIARHGAFFNEYLHYYYHRDEVLSALLEKKETRGEEVLRLTTHLLEALKTIEPAQNPDKALDTYRSIMEQRSSTYMAHARGGAERPKMETVEGDEEGYAAIALSCMEAIVTDTPLYTGLNVPNNGAIAGMEDDDVVEVGCWVDGNGPRPVPVGVVSEDHYLLMRTVKRYERLAAQAILRRSRSLATAALAVHPLVGSYPLARKLVNEFLDAHKEIAGIW